jgi:hypothetical protein
MIIGDLVRCKRLSQTWASGTDTGVGLIIQLESYDNSDGPSIHVQWPSCSLWYEPEELEVISGDR